MFAESAAARPKLKLLPRSVGKPLNEIVSTERNAAIFGTGKPRDVRESDFDNELSSSPTGKVAAESRERIPSENSH